MEQQDLISITPPNSVDAERSVLGAAMQDAGAATLAIETLQADDFYSPEHQEIFGAVKTLFSTSASIDVMTVSNELSRKRHAGRRGRIRLPFVGLPLCAHYRQHGLVHPHRAGEKHPAQADLRLPPH